MVRLSCRPTRFRGGWDRKLIWLGTNNGLYLLSSEDLGEPVLEALEVSEWSLDGLNAGHP